MVADGQRVVRRRTFAQADFDRFAALSGDDNPIHVDPDYSARSRFGRPVAHGMLLYGVLSGAIGGLLPGAHLEEIELVFPRPTFAGEAMEIDVRVSARTGSRVDVELEIRGPAGAATCIGTAILRDGAA